MNLALNNMTSDDIDRVSSHAQTPAVLADIFKKQVDMAIWERTLDASLSKAASYFLASNPQAEFELSVSSKNAWTRISNALGQTASSEFVEDITELVDRFCDLLKLSKTRLRLTALDRAMCPRFHVDMLTCRLVTTYHGVATEWLPQTLVDRTKLGPRSSGKSDLEAGLFANESDIQSLTCGDVALLKGELWEGNADAGLVHRSPAVPAGSRLLLTLDI